MEFLMCLVPGSLQNLRILLQTLHRRQIRRGLLWEETLLARLARNLQSLHRHRTRHLPALFEVGDPRGRDHRNHQSFSHFLHRLLSRSWVLPPQNYQSLHLQQILCLQGHFLDRSPQNHQSFQYQHLQFLHRFNAHFDSKHLQNYQIPTSKSSLFPLNLQDHSIKEFL